MVAVVAGLGAISPILIRACIGKWVPDSWQGLGVDGQSSSLEASLVSS